MKRKKKKDAESIDAMHLSQAMSDNLIATYGLRMARRISRLTAEKIKASYDSMAKKYGEINW